MKKTLLVAALLALVACLTACGAQRNELDAGDDLVRRGDCAGAQVHLENTIAQPDSASDLAYAYYLKGGCAEAAGDFAAAYENYYAAMIVSCYVAGKDTHADMNSHARGEYCQKIIPAKLEDLSTRISDPASIERIEAKVDASLRPDYLDRFEKRLN